MCQKIINKKKALLMFTNLKHCFLKVMQSWYLIASFIKCTKLCEFYTGVEFLPSLCKCNTSSCQAARKISCLEIKHIAVNKNNAKSFTNFYLRILFEQGHFLRHEINSNFKYLIRKKWFR